MEIREVNFWASEADRRRLRRKVETLEDVRFAMWAKGDDFVSLVRGLRNQLMTTEERRAAQDNAWLQLRVVGRG